MCVVKGLILNVDSFPSQGRLHLLLIILSGTAKMHFNIFLFNRTVVQATQQNFEVLPTQNTFCVQLPISYVWKRNKQMLFKKTKLTQKSSGL